MTKVIAACLILAAFLGGVQLSAHRINDSAVKVVPLYFHFIVPSPTRIQNYKEVLDKQLKILNESVPDGSIKFVVVGYNIRVNQDWYNQITGSPKLAHMRLLEDVPGAVNIYTIGNLSLIVSVLGETMENGDIVIYGPAPTLVVAHEIGHSLGLEHVHRYHDDCFDLMNPIMSEETCKQFTQDEVDKMLEYVRDKQ